MATPLLLGRNAPRCLVCLRQSWRAELYDPISSFQRQVRGKKRQAKTVQARLNRDIATWGRRGTVINVAPGRMRNIWLPRGFAQYVTADQLKITGEQAVDRDPTYGIQQTQALIAEEPEEPEKYEERQLDIQVPLLKLPQVAEIIDNAIPPIIQFFRKPIISRTSDATPSTNVSQNPAMSSVRGSLSPEILAAASEDAQKAIDKAPEAKPGPIAIYGSVTTADITTNIRAVLAAQAAEDDDSARVVLNVEDVFIVHEAEATGETDRIKSLGDFVMEIRLLNAPVVRRTVRVEAIGSQFQSEQNSE